ncbi:MAG: SMP-30/gluconolactonase/LRE family protein, partial [Pseudomonadota bacterium]
MSEVFDSTRCILGEGPLWHPVREQFLWFDINAYQLLIREQGKTRVVQFDEHVSAAGWVDDASVLIASETRLFLFDLDRERSEDVEGLEPDDPRTRSNDGRADPWGGFWIGT